MPALPASRCAPRWQAPARSIALTGDAAQAIAQAGKTGQVALLIDDRLDCVLAAREQGIAVDGVHVGQSDIPVEVCRKLLGPDAIVGLSARCEEMLEYVKTADMSLVDYLGIGPLHETETKRDCGRAADGSIITKALRTWPHSTRQAPCPSWWAAASRRPTCRSSKATGVDGFFVVSAVCSADDPYAAAKELVDTAGRHKPSSRSAASHLQQWKAHPSLDLHSGMRFAEMAAAANSGTRLQKICASSAGKLFSPHHPIATGRFPPDPRVCSAR